jgi:nucleoid-associated protein YgaU
MAKKKTGIDRLGNFDTSRLFSTSKSYVSLIYGALTVVVIFTIVFLGIRTFSQRPGTVTDEAGQTETEEAAQTYDVKEGDSLWSIAEQVYKDGYKWSEIAKENNIENPDLIEKGMKLKIPTVMVKEEDVTSMESLQTDNKITTDSYTVVEGDNLWTIAVRAYGDGYKWAEVAQVNKLDNPDVIHVGNKLALPR